MELISLLLVLIAGLISGIFGTLVGGGSLLTIPILIFIGLPPHVAIGTNRFGYVGLSIAGWYKFHKKKMIDYKIGFIIAVPSLIGALVGAFIMLEVNEAVLKKSIAVLTLVILTVVMYKPQIGVRKIKQSIKTWEYIVGLLLSFVLGAYGAFYGAGGGTFYSYLLILLFGQTFLESAGTRKIAHLFFSLFATIVFIVKEVIAYDAAIVLFIGLFIGSYIGASYSDKIGNKWLKRLFFVVVVVMAIKLLI